MIFPSRSFIERFKETQGAFSVCESIALMNIAWTVPSGNYIECGSNAGKSGMSAAYGLSKGIFYMIDPIFDLTNREAWSHSVQEKPENLAWNYVNEEGFNQKVKDRISFASAGRVTPVLLGSYSEAELPKYPPYSFAFIDSDIHAAEVCVTEVKLIEDLMVSGGAIAFHDYGNQYHGPMVAYQYLLSTGKYEPIEIDWDDIFNYVRDRNLEEGNDSWHQNGSNEFPKYVGAVRKK